MLYINYDLPTLLSQQRTLKPARLVYRHLMTQKKHSNVPANQNYNTKFVEKETMTLKTCTNPYWTREQANRVTDDRIGPSACAYMRLVIPGDGRGVLVGVGVGVSVGVGVGVALLVVPAHPQRAHHRVLGARRRALHLLSGLEPRSKHASRESESCHERPARCWVQSVGTCVEWA